ncbi:MAG: DnaB-like helicase C-terminal domain-containing protein [Bacilli bacterium]|jgi:replicative DNA helicase|nr:DnaB-like helicase C-terminal domain-containing protein [Bacilli bacterium]MDY0143398.1 DnaB-like helicase C-terminal domain-containing protein [Bacteroidales bacterium]
MASLPVKTTKRAIEEAKKEIKDSKITAQMCLKTRWPAINDALMGGFRFNNNTLLAGASGHGKSYFLNLVIQDFLNPTINGNFKKPFKIIHFNFEMSAADELLRITSSKTGLSYGDLLSAKRKLNDLEYAKTVNTLNQLQDDRLLFVETPGNRIEIEQTIRAIHKMFPKELLVIVLDHTLLVNDYDESSEVEKLAKLGKLFIGLKKEIPLLTILLGQLNDNIEHTERRNPAKPILHFPIKTDIFGSRQIYHAMDTVIIIHRPELLYLESYGPMAITTQNLIAIHFLKMRKGQIGFCKLKSNFQMGLIENWIDIKKTNYTFNTI